MFEGNAFSPASFAALSWLLDQIIAAVQQTQQAGGGIKTRRRTSKTPVWLPELPTNDEEDALLLIGLI